MVRDKYLLRLLVGKGDGHLVHEFIQYGNETSIERRVVLWLEVFQQITKLCSQIDLGGEVWEGGGS